VARPRGTGRNGRQIVIDAAVANFTERGFHGTSMRDIAQSAGVTVASIYHHFASKQEILQHIMVGTMTEVLALTRAAVDTADAAGAGPAERLAAIMEAWALFHTQRREEALVGASEIRSLDDAGRAHVVGLRDEQEALFRSIVEDGVDAGDFTTAHPLEATRAIITMGTSLATWYRADGPVTPEEMAHRYRDLALAAVGA